MSSTNAVSFELIEDDDAFAALVDRLVGQELYAIDTEFHRERTYFPQVALVQIADAHGIALVDALAVDLHPFAKVLDGPGLAVMHAARQDMEVMERSCGTIPSRLIDTQLAAGFLGYTSPSLSTLLERELQVKAPKADRLTDWLRRPLGDAQLTYAAADVAHLLELHDILMQRVEAKGRTEWVEAACEELRTESRGPRDPDDAWRRIKEIRHLRDSSLAIAQAVAAWREQRAIDTDQTPRFVLSDLGVVGVAAAAPTTVEELRSLRGVDGRNLRGGMAEELLAVAAAWRVATPRCGPRRRRSRRCPPSCVLRCPSSARGSASVHETSSSRPRCWPPDRTSRTCCAACPMPDSPSAGAPSSSASPSAGSSRARRPSPSSAARA